jgi:PAS domain-containing protein
MSRLLAVGELLAGGVNRFRYVDRQYRWFHTPAGVIRDEAGNRIASHGVMLDATPLKAAEMALQQSEQVMQSLMDTLDHGYIVRSFGCLHRGSVFEWIAGGDWQRTHSRQTDGWPSVPKM